MSYLYTKKVFAISFLFLALANSASALTTYAPGETIDPSCAPAVGDCYVDFSDNGLTQTTNGIGLGGTLNIDTTIDISDNVFGIRNDGGSYQQQFNIDETGFLMEYENPLVHTNFDGNPIRTVFQTGLQPISAGLFGTQNFSGLFQSENLNGENVISLNGIINAIGDDWSAPVFGQVQGLYENYVTVSDNRVSTISYDGNTGDSSSTALSPSGFFVFGNYNGASYNYRFPNSTPIAGQVLVAGSVSPTDLEWVTPSAGSTTPTNGLSLIGSDIGLGGTLTQDTSVLSGGFDFDIKNSAYPVGFVVTNRVDTLGVNFPKPYAPFAGINFGDTVLNGVTSEPQELVTNATPTVPVPFGSGSSPQITLRADEAGNRTYLATFEGAKGMLLRSEIKASPTTDSSDIVLNEGNLHLSATSGFYLNTPNRILNTATNGQVLTLIDALTGQVEFQSAGGGASPQWYAENAAAPAVAPVATGAGSIAFGDNAQALAQNMFVFGDNAGGGVTNAAYSNFIGAGAGYIATNASYTNALGFLAGRGATQANNSQFIGPFSGQNATYAANAVFIGLSAGNTAANAVKSIFIGNNAGLNDTVNNTTNPDDFSILLGPDTSTGGFSNSIAIGGYATNTSANQFMIGSSTRPIDETRINGSGSTQCTITTGTGIACTSDERMKENIVDLDGLTTLDKLLNVRAVTYTWKNNPNNTTTQIGFLAQDLEAQFPELVATDSDGYKSVYYSQITPILTRAIQEIANVAGLFRDNMIAWMGSAANGIERLFVREVHTETLCVGTICLTEDQVRQILQSTGQGVVQSAPSASDNSTTTDSDPIDNTVTTDTDTATNDPVDTTPSTDTAASDAPAEPVSDTPSDSAPESSPATTE